MTTAYLIRHINNMRKLLFTLFCTFITLCANAQNVPEITVATSDKEPVQMAAALYHLQGDTVEVVLHAKIHQGYHIYANVSEQDPFIKTEITMTPAEGYKKVGIMRRPARRPLVAGSKTTTHEGDCVWRQRYVGKSDSADATFNVTVEYQCCDNNICFPPKTLTFNLK